MIKKIVFMYQRYKFLLYQLVLRDFKVKYKRSFLGVLWSLLYPLLMMGVMVIIFSNVFKFSVPGVNYLVYLMTGLVIFNYFSEASNLALGSVVGNFNLINKIYIPKYIFPLAKCLFVGINFLLTLIPLYLIIFITGQGINIYHLLLPIVFLCLLLFTIGMGFILSTITVFMRDMFYIYGIIITIWNYFTPIMYDISMLSEKWRWIFKLNPLYQYVDFARTIILYGQCPNLESFLACIGSSLLFFAIGVILFRKKQDKFIYYA